MKKGGDVLCLRELKTAAQWAGLTGESASERALSQVLERSSSGEGFGEVSWLMPGIMLRRTSGGWVIARMVTQVRAFGMKPLRSAVRGRCVLLAAPVLDDDERTRFGLIYEACRAAETNPALNDFRECCQPMQHATALWL